AGKDQPAGRRDRARAAHVEQPPPGYLVVRQVHRDEGLARVGADLARRAEAAADVIAAGPVRTDRRVWIAAGASAGAVARADVHQAAFDVVRARLPADARDRPPAADLVSAERRECPALIIERAVECLADGIDVVTDDPVAERNR